MGDKILQFPIARTNGLRFAGFSSSYRAAAISREVSGVVSEADVAVVIGKMNEAIQSYWPCGVVYAIAICIPCCPNLCVAKAEEAGRNALHQMSLRPCFYDNQIRFRLVKTWFNSFVVVEFPAAALGSVTTNQVQLVTAEPRGLGVLLKTE